MHSGLCSQKAGEVGKTVVIVAGVHLELLLWELRHDSMSDFIIGAIELSVLSQHYQTEISAFDVSTKKMYCYGMCTISLTASLQPY